MRFGKRHLGVNIGDTALSVTRGRHHSHLLLSKPDKRLRTLCFETNNSQNLKKKLYNITNIPDCVAIGDKYVRLGPAGF